MANEAIPTTCKRLKTLFSERLIALPFMGLGCDLEVLKM
jgi:hypothetical protein